MNNYCKDKTKVQKMILTYCLGQLFWGYHLGVYTSSQDTISKALSIPPDSEAFFHGLMTALFPLGGLIGSFMGIFILQRLSRLQSLMFADLLGIIGSILSTKITYAWIFGTSRALLGINAGLNFSLVCSVVKEMAPAEILQQAGTIPIFFNNMGVFIAYLFGIGFSGENSKSDSTFYLQFVYFIPIILPILRIYLLKFQYPMETPYYYLERGDKESLNAVLHSLYFEQYVPKVAQDYNDSFVEKSRQNSNVSEIFTSTSLKKIQIGVMLMYFIQMSGTYAIIFFSTKMFEQSTGGNRNISLILTMGIGLTPVFCSYVAGRLSHCYGRKALLKWGLFGLICINLTLGGLSNLSESLNYSSSGLCVLVVVLIFISRSYVATTYGPNSFAYCSDILYSKSLSIVYLFYWVFEATIGFAFPFMIERFGIGTSFIFFAANCALGLSYVNSFVKETKGLTRKQIDCLFYQEMSHIEIPLSQRLLELV